MTRTERENLIERYLQGEMSLHEEENFFIEVAANRELRYELKAYQVVERAIVEDRTSSDRNYTALRGRMQGQLAASRPAAAAPIVSTDRVAPHRLRRLVGWIAGAAMISAAAFITTTTMQHSSTQEPVVPSTTHTQRSQNMLEEPEKFMSREMKRDPEHSSGSASPASPSSNVQQGASRKNATVSEAAQKSTSRTPYSTSSAAAKSHDREKENAQEGVASFNTDNTLRQTQPAQVEQPDKGIHDSISIRFEVKPPRSRQP